MSALDQALRWHDMGITPIPCRYRSKQPVVSWGAWKDKLPPLPLVRSWFAGLYNIAIIIPANLIVLDFDIPGYYHRWRMSYPSLADTYTVKSRRGYHAYLWSDEQIQTAGMAGGDILAAGHMNTVPCSVHKTGHQYQGNDKPILRIGSFGETGITPIEREQTGVVIDQTIPTARVWLPTGREDWEDGDKPVDRIKSRLDMYGLLRHLGVSITGEHKSIVMCCPFHEDRNPSFQVWADGARCHATHCRANRSMDVIDLAAMWWGVSNKMAIGMLLKI